MAGCLLFDKKEQKKIQEKFPTERKCSEFANI